LPYGWISRHLLDLATPVKILRAPVNEKKKEELKRLLLGLRFHPALRPGRNHCQKSLARLARGLRRSYVSGLENGPYRSALLARAALAVWCLAGCVPERPGVRPARNVADRGSCESSYVSSIWKGEDVSGTECAGYFALAGQASGHERARVVSVCEHAQIRSILTGEAAPPFTQHACSGHVHEYQQATLRRTCRAVSRSQARELTAVQSAACGPYLDRGVLSAAGPGTKAQATANSAPPPNTFATVPDSVAAAVPDRAEERVRCEDSYIESIWKGQDLTAPECAGAVGDVAYTATYNRDRVQSICEGAEIRSLRRGEALKPFSFQACQAVLPPRPSPEELARVEHVAGSDGSPAPREAPRPGLSEAAISSTVDANWRSIGHDCRSVAPRSPLLATPVSTQVTVTVTVAASGEVRDVSARAGGRHELERCIELSVRGWRFPAAEGSTVVGFPLVFAGR
jgi:hypothetical protein